MRYAADHKEHSRERILHAAAGEFRRRGVDAVRVSDVMASAGMTVGGFYKHFNDKDQLLGEAVQTALEQTASRFAALGKGKSRTEALAAMIAFYLSEEHVKHPELGCALAALGTEIGRMPPPVRAAVNAGLNAYAAKLSALMPGQSRSEREAEFLVLFASMAGCIMTARALEQRARQRHILDRARVLFTRTYCGEPQS